MVSLSVYLYSDPSVCLAGAHYYAGHDPGSLSHAVINQSRPDVSTYSTLPLLNQKISSLYFPPSLSDCCLPSHLDTEVTVHNIEAGQQRGDEVGLVAPHEGGGLVELLQHVALAHQQTEVVRELFLKRYSLLVSVSVLLESGVKVKHNTGLSKVIILTQQGRGL